MQLDLAAVDHREEVAADVEIQRAAEEVRPPPQPPPAQWPAGQRHGEDIGVAVAQGLEAALEAAVKAPKTRGVRLGSWFSPLTRPMVIGVNVRDSAWSERREHDCKA